MFHLQLSTMIHPNSKTADWPQKGPALSQDLFRVLVYDVRQLLARKSEAAEREQEGRTAVMRTLRQLRDWVTDRSTVLSTLHASSSPLGNPRFGASRQSFPARKGYFSKANNSGLSPVASVHDVSASSNKHAASEENQNPVNTALCIQPIDGNTPQSTNRSVVIAVNTSPTGYDKTADGDGHAVPFRRDDRLCQPFATSTPKPSDHRRGMVSLIPSDEAQGQAQVQAISSVLDGVNVLDRQLREYIHFEILLTDKFRHEMRMKQVQKKSLGFTSKGIAEAQNAMKKLTSNNNDVETLAQLQGQMDRIYQDYKQCSSYMDRAAASMSHITDVEAFLKILHDREKMYANEKSTDKDGRKENGKVKKGDKHISKQDTFDALMDILRCSGPLTKKQQRKGNSIEKNHISRNVQLPIINAKRDFQDVVSDNPSQDLVTKMKILVANYEVVRLKLFTLEDRLRREISRTERKAESLIKSRDDEIFRLQTHLRETDAEKDKYKRLYDNTKIATSRKY